MDCRLLGRTGVSVSPLCHGIVAPGQTVNVADNMWTAGRPWPGAAARRR